MHSLLKGIALSLACIIGLCAALPALASPIYSIERLSLFIYDGTNVYEDRRITSPGSNLPTGLTVNFNETIDADQNRTWVWTFHNTNATALTNLRITGFLDADLSAPVNTFFNEYGELIALSAPADHIAADRWEIGEPGYLTGDLLVRASQGNLQNLSTLSTANPDDAAMALSLPIGTLEADQTLTVTGTLTATQAAAATAGLRQIDADDGSQIVFQLYAQKGATGNPPTTSDYHVTLTTGTPTVTVSSAVTYQITIGNHGPDNGEGITLTDDIPAAISNVTWTCDNFNGAICGAASGSGNTISLTAQVPTTGTITIAVNGTAATTGTHSNTATIKPRGNTVDPVPGNNASSVNVTVNPAARSFDADLEIEITTSTPTVDVGDTVNYQIVATNHGNEDVDGITLIATIPNAVNGVTWTCAVISGAPNTACGTANGSGNSVVLTVDLQVGGIITIDVTGTARTAGTHTATSAIDPLNEVNDPDRSNNTSSVGITINGVTPTGTALPIPSSSLGMLALLALALGVVALCVKPMRKTLFPAILLAAFFGAAFISHEAKAVFQNGNFETGTFNHWQELRGLNYGLSGTPPFTGDDIRITAGGVRLLSIVDRIFDPRAPHLELPREGNFTAKVNDETPNYHLNAISQKGTITEADRDPVTGKLHVRFTYAAVLEDPGHEPAGQPYFHVLLKDLTSDTVLYDDFAYSNQPGRVFYTTRYLGRLWRSTPFIDVDMEIPDSSLSHEIEVRALAADCAHSAHGGYVYVDAFGSLAIPPQGSCLVGLKARGKPRMVQLTWPDSGATQYVVYRATRIEGPYVPLGVTESRYATWLDETVDNETVYYYNVRPLDVDGREMCSSGEVIGVAPEDWKPGDPLNRPPYFVSEPITTGDIRATYSYTPDVRDADGDTLTFSLLYGPIGMTVDPATGQLDWQPVATGPYRINLEVNDGRGNVANQAFTVDVTDSNRPPVINNPMPDRIPESVSFAHELQATDPDGDAMIYAIASQADGLMLSESGRLTWNSPIAGRYPVTIVVSDIHGAKTRQQLVLQVMGYPRFVSYPVIRATVGVPYVYQAHAEDNDSPVLKYSLPQAPAGMTINEDTGLIEWTATATGSYSVTVEAEDPDGNTGQQRYTIQVTTTPNRPPAFTGIPVVYVAFPNTYNYTASATDPDGDTLVWTLKQGPAGMTIVETNGRITWSPGLTTEGVFTVEVEVSDQRGGIDTQIFDVRVPSSVNKPPQINSTPTTSVRAGLTYSYTISASDPDGETVTLSLLDGPTGMQLNNNVLSWATTVADIGLHNVQIEARDPRNGWATQTWTLEVFPATVNRAPTISSTPSMTGTAGVTYVYQVSASDPDGDPITYALNIAPAGMTISATGRVEWPIPIGTMGVFDVEIEVADNKGAYVRQSYSIGVGETGNRPPSINSNPSLTGTAGSTYIYQISASDPDGDPITYALNIAPDGMTVSTTGRIEWPIPVGTEGVFDVEIEVSDGRGGYVQQNFTIAVGAGNTGNRPPRFTSTPTTTGTAGGSYTYQVTATDPDSDPLTFTLTVAPADMTISVVNATTSRVEWVIPADALGDIAVEIEVSDGRGGFARQGYAISVAGSGNRAPRITSAPATTAYTGTLYTYQVTATDPDGDPLTFTLTEQPTGMILSATNRVEWTPTTAQNGYHDVAVMVSDGRGGSTIQTWTIYVQMANNRPPRITSEPVYRGRPGVPYQYNVIATDPDGDALTYSLVEGPTGMTISPTGLVNWPNPITGNYAVTVKVSDPHGAYVTQSYTLQIDANRPPVITSVPVTTVTVNTPYRYEVQASDPDGDFLTYQLPTRPAGMTISSTGVIEWTPTNVGTFNVIVRVSDGQISVDQSFTVNVRAEGADPFAFDLQVTPQIVGIGEDVTIQAFPTGGTPPYTVTSFRVNNQNVTYTGYQATVSRTVLGRYTVQVTLRDSKYVSLTQESWFSVTDGIDTTPPIAIITAPGDSTDISVNEITTVTDIIGTASDDVGIAEYVLYLSESGKDQWVPFHRSGTAVIDGKLGAINPQTLANGLYDIGLIVTDLAGNPSSARTTVAVIGQQKIGQYSITLEDLNFDVLGLPLTVNRTYDTLRRNSRLDFGYGWSVDYQDVTVQSNGVLGRQWEMRTIGSGLNQQYCFQPKGSRVAMVRLPGGQVEQFTLRASPECVPWLQWLSTQVVTVGFTPKAGVSSKLEALDVYDLRLVNDELFDMGTLEAFDPSRFKLTTQDGIEYTLDKNFGIQSIKDRSGNTLTFTANGITHSGGWALQITRDTQRRITKITAPGDLVRTYQYDANGDLIGSVDPNGGTSSYTYAVGHLLTDYTDPSGNVLLKTEYDSDGRVTRQTDGLGRQIQITHDTAHNIERVRDRNGRTTVYLYDERGNIEEVTDALGNITRYTYDANDNETSVTDPLGRTTTRAFDAYGNVTQETDPSGHLTKTSYNSAGKVTEIEDALGRKTQSGYNPQGDLTRLTDAEGNETAIGYSPQGDLLSLRDPLNNQTLFGYDTVNGKRLKVRETDAQGNITTFTYDAAGRETGQSKTVTVKDGDTRTVTTTRTYDPNGNVLTEQNPLGHTTVYRYTPQNQLESETDPLGRITRHEYNARGEKTKTTHPDGKTDTWTYDNNGNETRSCTTSVCTDTAYDELNRPTKITDAANNITQTAYDAAGQVIKETDPRGFVTEYDYDLSGRKTEAQDPLGNTTQYTYDPVGNLTEETDPLGHTTEHRFDNNNRRTETKLPTGATLRYGYDAAGRRTRDTDAENHSTHYGYDSLGRLETVTDAQSQPTGYRYNEAGQLLAQTDAEGRETTFGYDLLGRRTGRTLPNGDTETWAYDAVGNLTGHTDFNGKTTTFELDEVGRITKVYKPDGRVLTNTWNSYGYLTNQVDTVNGTVGYGKDALDRPTNTNSPIATLTYQWDRNSNKTQMRSNQNARTINYTYDALNRVDKIVAPDNSETQLDYDANGNRTKITRANGTTSEYTYNAANQLTGVVHKKADNTALASFQYTLDENGRKTKATETINGQTRTIDYTYDETGKLTQEKIQEGIRITTTDYRYDNVGNRTKKTTNGVETNYVYNVNDQLTSKTTGTQTTTYTYDNNGNLTTQQTPAGTITYTWNSDNKLTGVNDPVKGITVTYRLDAEGKRIGKTLQQGATRTEQQYLIDPARPYSEIVQSWTRVNNGAWSADTVYLMTPDGIGDLIAQTTGTDTTFVLQDGQGSSRIAVDNDGTVKEVITYDAFGNRIDGFGHSATDATNLNHLYVGEHYDADSGFYHLRARDYDPAIGRFTARDGFEGVQRKPLSLNLYLYANSDPVNVTDPSGYFGLAGMGSAMSSMASMATMAYVRYEIGSMITRALITPIISSFLPSGGFDGVSLPNGSGYFTGLITSLATMCAVTKGKRCYIKGVPLMSTGIDLPFTSGHILAATMGYGNTGSGAETPLSSILFRKVPPYTPRNWYNKFSPCKGFRPGTVCDEYPYASTWNGGEPNYLAGKVSLMLVPAREGGAQGTKLNKFYTRGPVPPNFPFLNIAIPFLPSFYIDKQGRFGFL